VKFTRRRNQSVDRSPFPGRLQASRRPDKRQALHDADVHRGIQSGIGGGGDSVVLSGGFVDDVDNGDVIFYTGHGGRDSNTGRQVRDQELTRGNKQLDEHFREGNPIRVCRGSVHGSPPNVR
jgi:putative restriction endonuclease